MLHLSHVIFKVFIFFSLKHLSPGLTDSYSSLDADTDLINEKMLSSLILLMPPVRENCMKRGGLSVSDI